MFGFERITDFKKSSLMHRRSGFTLIELVIVLTIIALVAGSVLVGRDMIKAAQSRKILSEVESIASMITAFQTKFSCLPGDCANASSYLSGATDGNGNRRIGQFQFVENAEIYQMWYHLKLAGFISGTYDGVNRMGNVQLGYGSMPSSVNPETGYTVNHLNNATDVSAYEWSPPILPDKYGHGIMYGTQQTPGACCETYAPAISATMAQGIDVKVDDGLPGKGKVFNILPQAYTQNCQTTLNPDTSVYNTANGNVTCSLTFLSWF